MVGLSVARHTAGDAIQTEQLQSGRKGACASAVGIPASESSSQFRFGFKRHRAPRPSQSVERLDIGHVRSGSKGEIAARRGFDFTTESRPSSCAFVSTRTAKEKGT